MKYSQLFVKTQKEVPSLENSKNAELLIRAGFIRKELAGVYSYLPLGLRVLRKIENIIREEMDKVGAQEILMPSLATKEAWSKTGRWDSVPILFKVDIAGGGQATLAPTHEETVTPLVQQYSSSYKDFPICVYQIQTKFRNEERAKSGLLRGREFLMKDAYSFHLSSEDFEQYYEKMKQVYFDIYNRLGLGHLTKIVAASGGAFSKYSHEYQTLCDIGEDMIFIDKKTGEAFNKEIAQGIADDKNVKDKELKFEEKPTVREFSVEASAKAHGVQEWQILKSVVFKAEKSGLILVAIRGDLEVSELLLADTVQEKIRAATPEELATAGLAQGFISPVETKLKVIGDESLKTVKNFVTGANKKNVDAINANVGRDFKVNMWGNFATPTERFTSLAGNTLIQKNAIEVGNIFPLSTQFSKSFGFTIHDETGKILPIIMGCYGIGVSRIMGALVEIFHDERGIVWPKQVAPFQIYLAGLGKDDKVFETCDRVYAELMKSGIEVFYDDRRDKKVGPGQKFSDHELMGIPTRVVISDRTLEDGEAEVVQRENLKDVKRVKIEEVRKILMK